MTSATIDSQAFKKILQKNIVLPLVVTLVLCAVFIGLVINLLSVSKWVDHTDQVIGRANETIKYIIDAETGYRGFLFNTDQEYLAPYNQSKAEVPGRFKALAELISDNPSQGQRLELMKLKYDEWLASVDAIVESRKLNPKFEVPKTRNNKLIMDGIRQSFDQFLSTEEKLRDQRFTNSQEQTKLLLVVTVLLSLATGVFIALTGRRHLLSLSETYEDVLQKQTEQNEILQKQAWVRSGQAVVSDKLRGELTVEKMGSQLMEFLADYIDCTLGALYVVNDGVLLRSATYAFSEGSETKSPKSFKLGEGIIGQVGKDHKMVKLDNLPKDYIQVASSLGHAPPQQIVLIPLTAEGTLQAVLELGFSTPITERSTEFLNTISESVGIGIKSAVYRIKLQELLEKTQMQAEELQAQQEELRVSNEELSEKSKSLQDAHARLESQHAEMEQTNEQLEEQKQTLDHQNQNLRDAHLAVEEKARELEAANQYKSEFLANMSHELRTPLNSTLILSKLLKDNSKGNLTNEQVEFAATIHSSGNDLLALINDILDLSKVEAGKLEIEPESFSLEKMVLGVEKTFDQLAKEKKITLKVEIDKSAPQSIFNDRQRLEQILKNLLSNAIKFTSRGAVEFRVSSPNKDQIQFSVKDTGVGIAPHQLGIIFEAFRQADGTTNRKYGGTGLGLSISKNLSHLLGGFISVESQLDQGSIFTLTLPITFNTDHAPLAHKDPVSRLTRTEPQVHSLVAPGVAPAPFIPDDRELLPSSKRLILIVEDEPVFARTLQDLVHELGYLALNANTTSLGFELTMQYRPQAILLDMKLPDATGLNLLDRLKENPKTRHIPVHIISSIDYSREALQLGAVGYALKSSDREELKKTIQKLEEKVNQQIKRVLVVEDDAVQRMAIEKLIGGQDIEIISVGYAKEALEQLASVQFDCMVVDLSLPDMSGFDLLKHLTEHRGEGLPPIIVYTGRSLSRQEEETLNRYSRSIIIKGARSPERLLDEVTLFLHQVEAKMTPEKQQILNLSRNRDRAFENRTVLLVDDDVRNIFALTSVLEQKGAKVKVARNGRESIEKLNDDTDIDLVLMDIMMPEMDGYTAMKKIRENPLFQKLPIIAVTAKAMKNDYEKCLEAGANDYLAKPVDVDKLVSLMRVWLPKLMGRS